MTNVVVLGNQRHPWCSEVHYARTLESLGCDVLRLQENEETPASVYDKTRDFGAQLVVYARTWGMHPDLTAVWRRLEDDGVVSAAFHLDLYLRLQREATIHGDPFWQTTYTFTADGDPRSAERFAELGINHHWSPPATMHDECVMGEYRPEFDHDIVFVGSGGSRYHAEWPYRAQLVNWLKRHYAARFAHYGGDGLRVVRDWDLNCLYRSAKVVVGDSLCLEGHRAYWSDRVSETLGRGGVLIHPDVPGLRDYMGLVPGVHCLFYEYGDWGALKSHIDFCLRDPGAVRNMAEAGQAKVRAGHTYAHRLARALHIMGLRDSPDPPAFEILGFGQSKRMSELWQ